jgi:ornithine cyclodeaminase
MRLVERAEVMAAVDEAEALAAIREAFIAFSRGRTEVAAVGHLGFAEPPGDCHVKSAHVRGTPRFVVKIAASFYRNPERGLSSSQGAMVLASAETGEIEAVLDDGGYLTDLRTALAGVLAAQAIARKGSRVLGIVGAGIQARMQAQRIAARLGVSQVLVWARRAERAEALAAELGGRAAGLEELCAESDLIVTTTPSTEVLVEDGWIGPGSRIVAVGADSPGKRELAPQILGRARVVVDSAVQCLAHGEAVWAAEAGLLAPDAVIELGRLLAEPQAFADDEIVLADLTGVAVQDAAIASAVWRRVQAS